MNQNQDRILTLQDIAERLIHHAQGTLTLSPEELKNFWRYRRMNKTEMFEFKHLEALGRNIVRPWMGRFENGVAEVKHRLPIIIEPKRWWDRFWRGDI